MNAAMSRRIRFVGLATVLATTLAFAAYAPPRGPLLWATAGMSAAMVWALWRIATDQGGE
jgi:hypothetical protein